MVDPIADDRRKEDRTPESPNYRMAVVLCLDIPRGYPSDPLVMIMRSIGDYLNLVPDVDRRTYVTRGGGAERLEAAMRVSTQATVAATKENGKK